MLPDLSGEGARRSTMPNAKGVIFGLNLTHTRGDLYRAVLEGIAFGTSCIFETYRDIGEAPKRLLAVGGGTRNPVWSQATSDVSGIAQTSARAPSALAMATPSLRRSAVGAVTRSDIVGWNPAERRMAPRAKHRAVYERPIPRFQGRLSGNEILWRTCRERGSSEFRIALAELGEVLARVDETPMDAVCEALAGAKRIGVYGCGREALQINGFAMRLFHLGLPVAVVGDMTMPPLGEGRRVSGHSGPGETTTVTPMMIGEKCRCA